MGAYIRNDQLQIEQQQNISYYKMNKSIAKTRNELERITYKINQLKTKYTAQSHPQQNHPNNQNNHMDDSYQEQYSDQRGPSSSNREHVLGNRFMQTSINFNQSSNKGNNNGQEEIYHKEFKVFRNQIYNYVDKCLIMGKERQQDIIEKAVQSIMGTSRGRPTTEREDRIRKIQQETTNCLSSIQDVMNQMKKNEKALSERIACTQYKLKKQIKELGSKIEQVNRDNLQQYIEQLIDSKKNKVQKQTQVSEKIGQKLLSDISKINQIQQRYQKDLEEIKLIMVNWHDNDDDGKNIDAHLISQISQSVLCQVKDWTNKSLVTLEQRMEQITPVLSRVAEIEKKLQLYASLKPLIEQVGKKMQQMESKQKQYEKSVQQQLIHMKQELMQSAPEIELMGKQIQLNIETAYLKPRLEQLKRQLTTKFNQQIQFNKQDLMINVEQTVFQKINKFYNQEKQRKSPKIDIDESKLVLKQDLKDIELQLKNLVGQQIQDKLDKHFSKGVIKTQAMDTSLNISSRQRTIQEEQLQVKKTQEVIQSKLSQFETDINETIKLLYEDIENRVNQMISHCGISQVKSEIESLKKQMRDVQTKVKSLTLIATTNPPPVVSQPNVQSTQYFETLRSEVYTDMGCQIEKISNILERTVEQMEGKVEKLDRNFSYIYERMSKIQYDNANFKDQLASKSALSTPKASETKIQPIMKTNSNQLLEALGQYNAGRYFFESS